MTKYTNIRYQSPTTTVTDMAGLVALTGMSVGDQTLVLSNNNLFTYTSSGWFKIATVKNEAPSAITGVNSSYTLATDGSNTIITAASTDPEGFDLSWSYSTTGLGSIATISQSDNVFTITPSTDSANNGTFTLTVSVTDNFNGAVSANSDLTLALVVSISNSKYTMSLVTAEGTSDNNNIVDSSSSSRTMGINGSLNAISFSPYRAGGYSMYFDGNGDHLALTDDASLQMGSGDFTIEAWIYIDSHKNFNYIYSYSYPYQLLVDSNGHLESYFNETDDSTTYITVQGSTAISVKEWTHVAVVRSGSTITQWVNGVADGTASTSATLAVPTTYDPTIGDFGSRSGTEYPFGGYIRDLRVVKGTAVYTATFTPPTSSLTAITNTSLLACHLPYLVDGSTNAHDITVGGNVSMKPFGPYDYLEYSASSHGGSLHVPDGSTDYMTTSTISLTGDYTIELWTYPTTTDPNYSMIFSASDNTQITSGGSTNNNSMSFINDGSVIVNPSATSTNQIKLNQWHHLVWVRSGSTVTQYLNGKANGSGTDSGTLHISDFFRYAISPYAWNFDGYAADLRIVDGTAVYTSAFTPPTAPLTAITNTTLLLSGTEASIIDKSQRTTTLTLNGNTTGSTTQVKFASTKSMYFDGTGDYVSIPSNDSLNFGSGEFTVEAWIYTTTKTNYQSIVGKWDGSNGYWIHIDSSGYVLGGLDGVSYLQGATDVADGSWHHIAMTRSGSTVRIFVDGTLDSSATQSNNATNTSELRIGSLSTSFDRFFNGYIQDFRITKDLARYTTTFTPPTESLKG